MSPVQTWAMVVAAVVICWVIWDAVKKSQTGQEEYPLVKRNRALSRSGLNMIDNVELIRALTKKGWRGDFWERRLILNQRQIEELNVIFLMALEKSFPPWPYPFHKPTKINKEVAGHEGL